MEMKVKGMHCKSCVMLVTDALEEAGAKKIKIKLDEKKQEAEISLEYSGKEEDIVKVIEAEGYKVL